EALGIAGADRDVTETEMGERIERRTRDERAGIVGRNHALAAAQSRRRIGARGDLDPGGKVLRRQRNVARVAGRSAGRIDADDVVRRSRAMSTQRRLYRLAGPDLVCLRERQLRDLVECTDPRRIGKTRGRELLAMEGRACEQILDLPAIGGAVMGQLLRRRAGLGLRTEDEIVLRHAPPAANGLYWQAARFSFNMENNSANETLTC